MDIFCSKMCEEKKRIYSEFSFPGEEIPCFIKRGRSPRGGEQCL